MSRERHNLLHFAKYPWKTIHAEFFAQLKLSDVCQARVRCPSKIRSESRGRRRAEEDEGQRSPERKRTWTTEIEATTDQQRRRQQPEMTNLPQQRRMRKG